MVPGGLRLGTPALTTRGFVEADFEKVADFVVRGIHIAKDLKTKLGPKLKDFRDGLANAPEGKFPEIDALKARQAERKAEEKAAFGGKLLG